MSLFDNLLNGLTADEIFDSIVSSLPTTFTTDWSDGSVPKTMLQGWSAALSRAYTSVVGPIAKSGFLNLAVDSWVPLIAVYVYGIAPYPALQTQGKIRFRVAPGSGPYPIASAIVATDAAPALRYFSTNKAPISISSAADVWIPIKAEFPGSAYNVLEGQITKLTTSLPGVTVSNVPEGTDPSWITTYGADAELVKQIIERCARRLGRLSKLQNYPTDGYISLIRDLSQQVKKVSVYPNYYRGAARPGCATIFLAGDTGPVSAATVAEVERLVNPYRNPLGTLFFDSCVVANQIVSGLVECDPDFRFPAVAAGVSKNLLAYQTEAQIGEKIYSAEIIDRIMEAPGVRNYVPPRTFSNLLLGRNQVVNFVQALQYGTVRK